MPLSSPPIDDRRYQQLVEQTLARVPVHTPEWTNFNASDPGVTLVHLFAFLTESLLYRANQIPERNRKKFLQLLGVPLRPATSAHGIVTFSNDGGELKTVTLDRDLPLLAGKVPFHTTNGLDVLPIEFFACYKRAVTNPAPEIVQYYAELYATLFPEDKRPNPSLYQLTPFDAKVAEGVDLANDSVDHSLWIALLARQGESPDDARKEIENKTLSFGWAPALEVPGAQRHLSPETSTSGTTQGFVTVSVPRVPANAALTSDQPHEYLTLTTFAVPRDPEVIEIKLREAAALRTWTTPNPLDAGVGDLPPAIEDDETRDRVITWLRLAWPDGSNARLLWAGINAARVEQRDRIQSEAPPNGNGQPDQFITLAKQSVIAESVRLTVNGEEWQRIDDLFAAGPEVPSPDSLSPPGAIAQPPANAKVFAVDAEAGRVFFGDGRHGARPADNAVLRVDYDFALGEAGNVAADGIKTSPALPEGFKVRNPLRTWGGADAETAADGEKQITRFLQHRERLVTVEDFVTVARRTPGVEVGRVEALPAFHPALDRDFIGAAPGTVTLMLIPSTSLTTPDTPEPNELFLKAVCEYLEPRRLVTTELFLTGPRYRRIQISLGFDLVAGHDSAIVRENIEKRLRRFLSPLPTVSNDACSDIPHGERGWPLLKSVRAAELMAEASRVTGVAAVNNLVLTDAQLGVIDKVDLLGLELPRLTAFVVAEGAPPDLIIAPPPEDSPPVPVPFIPKEC